MCRDEVHDVLLDVRPDRGPAGLTGRGAGEVPGGLAEVGHVLDRDGDREIPLLGGRRLHPHHRPPAGEEALHLLHRPHGGGQADPLRGALQEGVQPFEGEGEVGAALGSRDGVHLVQDDGLHAAECLAGLRGEDEEEGLGRGDEDVRAVAGEVPPFGLGGVRGAHRHLDGRDLGAEAGGGMADPDERGPEVALHVHGEGLHRGHVDHAAAVGGLRGGWGRHDAVEGPEEGGERLAGAGGRYDEGVLRLSDRLPRAGLGRRRAGERTREPLPCGRGEIGQGIHGVASVARRSDTVLGDAGPRPPCTIPNQRLFGEVVSRRLGI